MKTVIIIPARYGSTRYPGKPLVELRTREGKKSLISEELIMDNLAIVLASKRQYRLPAYQF